MAEETGTLERIAEGLANALTGLSDIAQPANLAVLLNELGIDSPPDLSGDAQLAQSLSDVVTRATDLTPRVEELILAAEEGGTVEIVTAGAAVLAQCTTVGVALDAVGTRLQAALATTPGGPQLAAELARRVIGDVIARYLDAEHPLLRRVLTLATVLDWDVVTPETDGSVAVIRRRLHVERLPKLLSDPLELLESGYGWGRDDFNASRLLQRISELFEPLDPIAAFGDEDGPPVPPVLEFGAFTLAPAATPPPGLTGELFLEAADNAVFTLAQLSDEWSVVLGLGGKFREGLTVQLLPPTRLEITPPPSGTLEGRVAFEFVGHAADPANPVFLLGIAGASRVEAKSVSAGVEARGSWSSGAQRADADVGIRAIITGGRILVSPAGGDGFLSAVLPQNGMQVDFDLEVGWSSTRGLHIEGGAGLAITIPVNRPVGPILLDSVNVGGSVESSALVLTAGITARVELGPVKAVVKDVGLRLEVDFESRGNLGIANLDLHFKPPSGLGLSVDGGGFKGGGFLDFEPENKRYVGVLELEFKDEIALKAIGLLNTELPGGAPGYSLLIVISAEFQPIQLGFGFTLNGVGGLLGLNRTVRIERLRTGIRDNTLSSILFPTDIVENASRIISDLREVFPPQADRFVFGPMAKIGWGTPTLLTIDLGLIIEVPAPVQLALLGVLRALIPDEEQKLLRLQVNFLGVVEFEKQQLAFDASLYDSKLLSYTLSGDMALRLAWGNNPNFLLSVGGFHPAYEPPPLALPSLRRLTLQLTSGNNPRLTLETYFAITSNTAQFGAKVELYASAGSFNVYGMLAFDALFQFNPFYFIADIAAKLALRAGSSSIASIKLSLTLEGPTPWKAKGTAKLKLCWFLTVKVRFNKTFGEERDTRLDDVAVLPLLQAALQNNQNWRSRTPDRSHLLVTVRELESATPGIIARPVGVLEVSQKVVPLNVRIDRFGHQRPSDGREFRITNIRAEGRPIAILPLKEFFAPAQFFEKSDAQKLGGRSFEKYDGGVGLSGVAELASDRYAMREVEYELSYLDSQRDLLPVPAPVKPDVLAFNAWAVNGAIARSPLSFARTGKSSLAPAAVQVAQEGYGVVQTGDLTLVNPGSVAASEAEAGALMASLIAQRPALAGRIQVVPIFEVPVSPS